MKVSRAGVIYLNGKQATMEQLKTEFARLKNANGAVWYYRENPTGQPPLQSNRNRTCLTVWLGGRALRAPHTSA